jgi:phosphomannomutase
MSERFRFISKSWEGVYAADFTLDQVRRRGYHLGSALQARGWSCLIAYDTRFMSNLFAHDIHQCLTHQGIPTTLVAAPAPMPAVQNALDRQQANCALVVTARNQPYWYNGLVLVGPQEADLPLYPGEVAVESQPFPPPPSSDPLTGQGQKAGGDKPQDLRAPYLDMLRKQIDVNLIRRSTMTIFVDPMNGTTAGYLPAVISEGGQTRAIEINRETDPLFSKLTPLPAETGLNRLRKLVRESDSHLGLAFSADGTALGVVDKNGEQLEPIEIVLLLAAYLVRQYRQKGLVIAPAPTADSRFADSLVGLSEWEDALGLKVELAEDASARIAALPATGKNNLLVGCSSEGGIILGNYTLYPDALLAGLMMAELVARNAGNLQAMLNELRGRLETKS